jgi:antitoxin FitA
MTTIRIELSDERAQKLKEMADRFGVGPEELARTGVEGLLLGPEEEFRRIFNYVINRNADLYQRLA